jgi:hypothetical protein
MPFLRFLERRHEVIVDATIMGRSREWTLDDWQRDLATPVTAFLTLVMTNTINMGKSFEGLFAMAFNSAMGYVSPLHPIMLSISVTPISLIAYR